LKQFILLLLLIALVLPEANAVPESVVTGPYKVSFDLGLNSDEYVINVTAPEMSEALDGKKWTEYRVNLYVMTDDYRGAMIAIKNIEVPIPIYTASVWKQSLKEDDPRVLNFKSDTRTIDGVSGAITSSTLRVNKETFVNTYRAVYQPLFDPTHTIIDVVSYYPWNEGTLQLLKTIHIEKA
jgi:hypothetical protein